MYDVMLGQTVGLLDDVDSSQFVLMRVIEYLLLSGT